MVVRVLTGLSDMKPPVHFKEPSREPEISSPGNQTPLHLVSQLEHIKQQMARDSIQFIRFEATDLHGVSRSKSIPSRFFHVSFYASTCTLEFHGPAFIANICFFIMQAAI